MAHTNTITCAQAEEHARAYASRLKSCELIGYGESGEEFYYDPSAENCVLMISTARYDTIHTRRLIMRRWQESDYEPFAALNADPEVMRYLPAILSRTQSDAMIARIDGLQLEPEGYGLWALELIESGEFIGLTGLNPMPKGVLGAGGTEVGWRLMRSAWHRGYATEAATAALDVAFNGLGLDVVYSMTSVLNLPSQAVMRKLGLTEFARFDHPHFPEGNPNRPHIWYRRTRPEVFVGNPQERP